MGQARRSDVPQATMTSVQQQYLRALVVASSSMDSLVPLEIELADRLIEHAGMIVEHCEDLLLNLAAPGTKELLRDKCREFNRFTRKLSEQHHRTVLGPSADVLVAMDKRAAFLADRFLNPARQLVLDVLA